MRRLCLIAVAVVALAVPATALAANFTHSFTLPSGTNTNRSFKVVSTRTGTFSLSIRYSAVRNPNAHLQVRLRKSTDLHATVLIDTATSHCTRASGFITCYGARADRPAGTYFISVVKLTPAAVPVTLRASWPS